MPNSKRLSICVIGLGYVGLPLTYHFAAAEVGEVFGYDTNDLRAANCARGVDHTDMIPYNILDSLHDKIVWCKSLPVGCDVYVICVPTPDKHGIPDYSYVEAATDQAYKVARKDSIIVLESTVAPGTVRNRLIPRLQANYGFDPFETLFAFSPERVNPGPTAFGDMVRCTKILAYDPSYGGESLATLVHMYGSVFDNVSHYGDTRVAEMAKCFENMQRDVNIALMNELSMICHRDGIDYQDVVNALRTKPGSPSFTSGLVGGHCIPVDPYYLAAYYDDVLPERIQLPIVGRKINEEYINYVTVLADRECPPDRAFLISGQTYKPHVNDIRNSGALKIAEKLRGMGRAVVIHDTLTHPLHVPDPSIDYGLVIGAVYHRRHHIGWNGIDLTIDCKFINIGEAFPPDMLLNFKTIINV